MNKKNFQNLIMIGVSGLICITTAQTKALDLKFTPMKGCFPAKIIDPRKNSSCQYIVTNISNQTFLLKPQYIPAIRSYGCNTPLPPNHSCVLCLDINNNQLTGDVIGGPILCNYQNPLECIQPSLTNRLALRLPQKYPLGKYAIISLTTNNGTVSPNGLQIVNSGTTVIFKAQPNEGYGINKWLVDGKLVQHGGTHLQLRNIQHNHQVTATFAPATITPSVAHLALALNCQPNSDCPTTKNLALTGKQRQITVLNTGSINVTNVKVATYGLPIGTKITSNTCYGTLPAHDSCIITLTPGSMASSDVANNSCTKGTIPVAGKVEITADNRIYSNVKIYVLSYGCQYQGGIVYEINDNTPKDTSIGGKVVSLVDQASPFITSGPQKNSIIWSSNGNGGDSSNVDYNVILGIDETSTTSSASPTTPSYPSGTPAYQHCNGNIDGYCNTSNIVSYYNFHRMQGGNAPTALNYYAAGLCQAQINGYKDWYLPAICEMDAVNRTVDCPIRTQSMLKNITFLIGDPSIRTPNNSCHSPQGTECLAGYYWSSTELLNATRHFAWNEYFAPKISNHSALNKNLALGVRCARELTF